jgi:hypothetical protein
MKDDLLFIQALSFSLPEWGITDSDHCPLKAGNSVFYKYSNVTPDSASRSKGKETLSPASIQHVVDEH